MCLRLIEAAGDMRVVFHRAFDCVIDLERNWSILNELGYKTFSVHGRRQLSSRRHPGI